MLAASDKTSASTKPATRYVALTGNPNCGKTTLFNALTGLRAKVGNYAGVTVECKEGRLLGTTPPNALIVLDLPGTYSLSPQSIDEQISRDVLLNRLPELPPPSLVVVVVDASNLQRNLYYATQVIELGYPTILALNMMDVAEANGHVVDPEALSDDLGVPVYAITANKGQGIPTLREGIMAQMVNTRAAGSSTLRSLKEIPRFYQLPEELGERQSDLAELIARNRPHSAVSPEAEALLALTDERAIDSIGTSEELKQVILQARGSLEAAGVDWRSAAIEARYARIAEVQEKVVTETSALPETFSDKLDRVLTHKIWGMIIFVAIMALMFQSIFTLAEYPMNWIEAGWGSSGSGWGAQCRRETCGV